MYLEYYGLDKNPFHITPDPEFLYLSESHKEALAAIVYGVQERKGFIVITGEVGLGKTTVVRSYLKQFDTDNLETVLIFNTKISLEELIISIYDELELEVHTEDPFELVRGFHHFLIENYHKGNNLVLLIDEAQNMPVETLEGLRMLSNLETSKDKLIQVVLIGQPELANLLERNELRQLKQRIAVRTTLQPLSHKESLDYIFHRLEKAGGHAREIFKKSALKRVVGYAEGIPRKIHMACDNALVAGLGYEKKPVTAKIVKEVIGDLEGKPRPGFPKKAAFALMGLAAVFAATAYISFADNLLPVRVRNTFIKPIVGWFESSNTKSSTSPTRSFNSLEKSALSPKVAPATSNSGDEYKRSTGREISTEVSGNPPKKEVVESKGKESIAKSATPKDKTAPAEETSTKMKKVPRESSAAAAEKGAPSISSEKEKATATKSTPGKASKASVGISEADAEQGARQGSPGKDKATAAKSTPGKESEASVGITEADAEQGARQGSPGKDKATAAKSTPGKESEASVGITEADAEQGARQGSPGKDKATATKSTPGKESEASVGITEAVAKKGLQPGSKEKEKAAPVEKTPEKAVKASGENTPMASKKDIGPSSAKKEKAIPVEKTPSAEKVTTLNEEKADIVTTGDGDDLKKPDSLPAETKVLSEEDERTPAKVSGGDTESKKASDDRRSPSEQPDPIDLIDWILKKQAESKKSP